MPSASVLLGLLACAAVVSARSHGQGSTAETPMPLPWSRVLSLKDPMLEGTDVFILQNMLQRLPGKPNITTSGQYNNETASAVYQLKKTFNLQPLDTTFDDAAAAVALDKLSWDGYKDDGRPAQEKGFLYKVVVPVHKNRSIETEATLYAGNGTALFSFVVRAHGIDNPPAPAWPYFNSCCDGLNQFTSDGYTPTGLILFDLNSPEDNSTEFGPWPVNRAVEGIEGNAGWLIPNIRDGILLHTGDWHGVAGWNPPAPMPNSLGCIHAWPQSIYNVWQLLTTALGVVVNPNTNGQLPYPYKPQGLLSVYCVDCE